MKEKLKQKLEIEMKTLPKELREVINSFDWMKIVEEVGGENLTDETEINSLQAETGVILVGLESPEYYQLNIENNIGISRNTAEKISEEITQKVFIPIYNKVELLLKNGSKVKNHNWKQTINFIISGGSYSVFLEENNPTDKTN